MEQEFDKQQPEDQSNQQENYVPRPAWQVWGARIGLVIFFLFLVLYYFTMFSGGGR